MYTTRPLSQSAIIAALTLNLPHTVVDANFPNDASDAASTQLLANATRQLLIASGLLSTTATPSLSSFDLSIAQNSLLFYSAAF